MLSLFPKIITFAHTIKSVLIMAKQIPYGLTDFVRIRTDYSKLRHFIRIDRMQKEGYSIISELIEKGEINGNIIKDSFPADRLADPDNFTSLLYYFGLITFDRLQRGKYMMKVPNLAVREQIYGYLTETMRENGGIAFPYVELSELMYSMAYDGIWEPVELKVLSSQQSSS